MTSPIEAINQAIANALKAGIPWIDIENEIEEARLEHDPYYDGEHAES